MLFRVPDYSESIVQDTLVLITEAEPVPMLDSLRLNGPDSSKRFLEIKS